ncbi:MAG TPA: hypothetical protein VFX96_20005 [Pyrinomonadaceae bacterium]|nr:hypothetical protein [Pyrinomonadaceae bacterium]
MKKICEGVWRDRAVILSGDGQYFTGEEALVGAAYWRLCKAGLMPETSLADCAPFLRELLRQYRAEAVPPPEGCDYGVEPQGA